MKRDDQDQQHVGIVLGGPSAGATLRKATH